MGLTEKLINKKCKVVAFGGTKINVEGQIDLECDIKPVSAVKPKLKTTLEKLEERKIIKKVTEPTDWVNNLVIVEKKDGSLRICLDPGDLNKAIKREHFQIPTVPELTSQLSGKKCFRSQRWLSSNQ